MGQLWGWPAEMVLGCVLLEGWKEGMCLAKGGFFDRERGGRARALRGCLWETRPCRAGKGRRLDASRVSWEAGEVDRLTGVGGVALVDFFFFFFQME